VSLCLPWWSAERARRRLGLRSNSARDAILLVRVRAGQQIVAGVDAVACAHGAREGQSLAQARTLLAGLTVHTPPHDAAADALALTAFARWITKRWSPIVSIDPPDGVLLDISGCEHLFGGETDLIASLEKSVRALGFTPRTGIASTVGTAWALARFAEGEDCIAPPGHERRSLSHLPIAALRVDADVTEGLAEVGIDRIGQLFDLPRHTLPIRYGPDLLRRLDQALGLIPELVGRTSEAITIHASRELTGGTTRLGAIERVVQMLLAQIATTLGTHESGLRRLDATFERMNADAQRMTIQVSRPTRDAKHLWSLLRPKVERLHMGFGVERITLAVGGIARLVHRQVSLAGERDNVWKHDGEFAAMLDTMASRLGRTNVLRAELVQSHRPERAFRLLPIDDVQSVSKAPDTCPVGPRPSRLFDPPRPAHTIALSPDGPVQRLRWSTHHTHHEKGHEHDHAIIASVGPERVGPEWWKEREPTRDYYRVQDENGRWLWLFREAGTSRWFVHGEWT